jgi:hypothetical protein
MLCQPEKEECLTIRIHTADPRCYVSCSYWEERCKIQGTHRVLKKFTGNCHHLLLLPLKYCSSRNKIFILFWDLILKKAVMTHESAKINYTADQNNAIMTNVSNSN